MAKKAVSLTLDETNLLWLKGRARVLAGGSLSEAVDHLIGEARSGKLGAAEPPRSVVGTIDIPADTVLTNATEEIRSAFGVSLARPIVMGEADRPIRGTSPPRKK